MSGLRDSHVMPTELTVALPPAGELLVPVQLGGRMKLLVTDGAGAFLSGHYRLEQNAQAVAPPGLGLRPDTALPLPPVAEHPSELFAPGS